jgi:hypothetical protein
MTAEHASASATPTNISGFMKRSLALPFAGVKD